MDKPKTAKEFMLRRLTAVRNAREVLMAEQKRTPFPEEYQKLEKAFEEMVDMEIRGLSSS